MARVGVFNNVSLDGYFADANSDMSWAHQGNDDAEWNTWVAANARGGGALLFGRKTYELMLSWWPTPAAAAAMPEVARQMNALPKIVFSRTLTDASWRNTRLIREDLVPAVRQLKADSADDMVILGSGTIVAQLTQAGLIDDYQLVINPIILGAGQSMFAGVKPPATLELVDQRRFAGGKMVLSYRKG
jgi:dihydrofolate reductase